MKKKARFTISNKTPFRYIAAVLALIAMFFTLFAIVPFYSTDYIADSVLPQENSPDSVQLWFRYSAGITLPAVLMLTGEAVFALLCLSSFINRRPWLLALPIAIFSLSYGLSVGALIELILSALFGLTAAGFIRRKRPTMLALGLYAAAYIAVTISVGIHYGDELIAPLMWVAVLLVTFSMKEDTEA